MLGRAFHDAIVHLRNRFAQGQSPREISWQIERHVVSCVRAGNDSPTNRLRVLRDASTSPPLRFWVSAAACTLFA